MKKNQNIFSIKELKQCSENDDLKALLDYCFSVNEQEHNDLYFKEHVAHIRFFGAMQEDKLVSTVGYHDYRVKLHGESVKMGGICDVASFPEVRSQGSIEALLVHALKEMDNADYLISYLSPFSYPFYRRYGWELSFAKKIYEIDLEHLRFPKSAFAFKRIGMESLDQIISCYTQSMQAYSGYILRDELAFKQKLLRQSIYPKEYFYGCFDESDNLLGYIQYQLKGEVFEVVEMVYADVEIRNAFFNFIYGHKAQSKKMRWACAPQNDDTMYWLSQWIPTHQIQASMMSRVVNVEKALLLLLGKQKNALKLDLNICDEYAPWNHALFSIENGKVIKKAYDDKMITLSIQQFSQLFIACVKLTDALFLSLQKQTPELLFQQLLLLFDSPQKDLLLLDEF